MPLPRTSRSAGDARAAPTLITIALDVRAACFQCGVGVLTSATIVGHFLFGVPSIIAVIMNYLKRDEARGTWLESHFNWQLRTFWFAALWVVLVWAISLPFMLVLFGVEI